MCLVSSLVTPYRVSFFNDIDVTWMVVEAVIDVFFFLDIIFSFVTAYHNQIEELIDNRRAITCNYLKCWFFIDFVSVLPLHHIIRTYMDLN